MEAKHYMAETVKTGTAATTVPATDDGSPCAPISTVGPLHASSRAVRSDESTSRDAATIDPVVEMDDNVVPDSLFPLAMTPLEQYLVMEDHPRQPMTAFVQLTFSQEPRRDVLHQALMRAIHRNPLLASRIDCSRNVWRWVYDREFRPAFLSYVDQPPVRGRNVWPIDLRNEPGLRAWIHPHQNNWRLLFQIHHACADGIGMRKFALDMLIAYSRAFAAPGSQLKSASRIDRLEHERLLHRGSIEHLTSVPPIKPLTTWQRIKNNYYFFFQPPLPLQGVQRAPLKPTATHCPEPVASLQFSLEESNVVLEKARQTGAGLNDLGLAILFHQCRKWHEQHSKRGPKKRIRLLMPLDIRTKDDMRLSAANRLSFGFLGRTHSQCNDFEKLLASVQAETQHIKDTKVYIDFLKGIVICQSKPRLFRWVLGKSQNMATAIFTYGGDIHRGLSRIFEDESDRKRVGDVLWEDVWAAPPTRSNTNIALGFCISRGRICMSLSWNREALTQDEAHRFLNDYATAWRNWAQRGTP